MKGVMHVINRLMQVKLEFIALFMKLWKTKPTVSYFQVFGCMCYLFIPDHLRTKFDMKAIHCIFVGYNSKEKDKGVVNLTQVNATHLIM